MSAGGLDPNLLPLRAEGARRPLFFVVAPGVSALGFVAVARRLPADLPIYVVQPKQKGRAFPGEGIGPRGRDEYPLVAAEYLRSIRAAQPRGPYLLSGMCDGALIAFEMARMLEAEGETVTRLIVFDTWPLQHSSIYPLVMLDILIKGYARRTPAERVSLARAWAGKAASAVRPRSLDGASGGAAGAPAQAEIAARRAQAAAKRRERWRAKIWPGRGFVPPAIEAPIVVLRVAQQPFWRVHDDALGWRPRTRGVVTVHILPGAHQTWFREPYVGHAAQLLSAYLDGGPRARADRPPRSTPRGPAAFWIGRAAAGLASLLIKAAEEIR